MSVSAKRNARIELVASSTGMDQGLADAKRKLRTFQREQAKSAKQEERDAKARAKAHGKTKANILGGIKQGIGMALGIDSIGGLADIGHDALDFDRQLTRLQVTGEMSTREIEDFRAAMLRTSDATGVSTDEIMKGSAAYIGFTGDAKGARESLDLLAKVTRATGASAADVGGIFATFSKNLHLDPSQWGTAMDILIKQAHDGGVELNDLAGNFASVSALYATSFSGGASVKGLAEVSAMAQVLQNMTHNAELTSTYLKDLQLDMVKNAGAFRDLKIEPFTIDPKTKKKVLKDGMDLLDALSKTKAAKDPEVLRQLFPEKLSRQTASYLLDNLDMVHKIRDASLDSNQLSKDFAIVMESSSGKIDTAWNRIKNTIAEALTPERAQAFADAIVKVADAIVLIVDALDATLSKVDVAGNTQKVLGERIVEQNAGLSPEAKRAKARQLYGQAMSADAPSNQFDEGKIRAMSYAAHALDAQATAANPWLGGASPGERAPTQAQVSQTFTPANLVDLARTIEAAINRGFTKPAPAPLIKIGAEPLNAAVQNSISHRRGG